MLQNRYRAPLEGAYNAPTDPLVSQRAEELSAGGRGGREWKREDLRHWLWKGGGERPFTAILDNV